MRRYGVLLIIVMLFAICLTGCGSIVSGQSVGQDMVPMEGNNEMSVIDIGKWTKVSVIPNDKENSCFVYVRVIGIYGELDDGKEFNAILEGHSPYCMEIYEAGFPADTSPYMLNYEIYIPEDFPYLDCTVRDLALDFDEVTVDGSDFMSSDGTEVYENLGRNNTAILEDEGLVCEPGNVYKMHMMYIPEIPRKIQLNTQPHR